MRVYIQPGCAEPEALVEALMRRAPEVQGVEIVHIMTMGCAPYVAPEMDGHFRHNAMFPEARVSLQPLAHHPVEHDHQTSKVCR